MSFTANAKALAETVSRAARACGKAKTFPYLATVKLAAADGVLAVTGTDLDTRITATTGVEGEFGPVCVDGARLDTLLTRLKDRGEITIAEATAGDAGLSVTVSAGRSRATLAALTPDGFPEFKPLSAQYRLTVAAAPLTRLLQALGASVSTEETRFYLNGICLMPGRIADASAPGHMIGVATNGHTLQARDIAASGEDGMPAIIVPRASCQTLVKLLPASGDIDLVLSEDKIELTLPHLSFTSKLIEGTFPDWRRVTPSQTPVFAYANADILAAARNVAAAVDARNVSAVRLTFGTAETDLSMAALNSTERGDDVCAHARLREGGPHEIGMNVHYLIAMLESLGADRVALGMSDAPNDPLVLTGEGHDDRRTVIMPMRI